jgi:hypothetical protein
MSRPIGRKLRSLHESDAAVGFYCPGCRSLHVLYVKPFMPARPVWGFNGDGDSPTFTPSVLISSNRWTPEVTPENFRRWQKKPWSQTQVPYVCHSFIAAGRIEFLSDSTHHLAGQTVDLPDMRL